MRRIPALLLATFALAGCGGSDRTHGGEQATPTPEGGTTPAPVVEQP
jgi:hypothetical protein